MDNIIKQGYLKKARPTEPDSIRPNFCNSFLQMFEPSRWYVFILRNATPYLEIFDKEESVFNSQPSAKINLSDCYKITYTMARTNKTWTFCIFLENRIIELSADTRDQMQDWCNHLERTLHNFGNLKQQTEHIYSEYPVKYTPRNTGLEQEQALEAAAHNTGDDTNDYQEFDFLHGEETDVKFNGAVAGPSSQPPRVPERPKSYFRSDLIGAEGGHDPNDADNDSDTEPDTSEDDFVGKDFFVTNKIPPVPVRSCSAYIPDHLASQLSPSSKDKRQNFCKSVPPLPQRPSSKYDKGPSFIESQPVPPPRRKKDKSATITRKISGTTSIDNIENLDDGYDSVVHLRKTEEKRRSLEENWYTFGEDVDDNLSANISSETGLFVNLPTKKTSRSNTPTPTNFLLTGPDFDGLRKQRRSSSDSGNGYHNLPPGREGTDSKDENYNDQKQDVCQFAKHMPLERDSLYDLSVGVGGARPRSRSPPLYDFGRGTNPEKSHDSVVGTPIPPPPVIPAVSSSLSSSSSHNRFSESDSLYSIPKSAKPVAGLSTEEVYRPALQNARRSSPGPDALYAIPQKSGGASRQSGNVDEHNLSKNVSPGGPSSPKVSGGAVGGKSPTDTSMISRPLPKIPIPDPPTIKHPESKDGTLKLPLRSDTETEESKNSAAAGDCRPTSPSHDGFHFNFVNDGSDSKSSTLSTSSGGAQSTGTPNEDDNTIYEDATGRRNVPPVPPKRIPILGRKGGSGRSVSVYIPSKGSGDVARLEPLKQSQDDESGSRNKGVSRQISLQERQHIPIRHSSVVHTVIPLKQSQVELLCEEQKQHGIELSISNKSASAIALVEFFSGIWIAGWDMRHFPRLADKLHIGDQLISVEDIRVGSVMQAQKLMRQTRAERVSIVVKRLPYAKVLAIRRSMEGEGLGITREGGTAEIIYVDPNGLVGHMGLTRKTVNVDGSGECNWALTEINCRPLNLSLKGNEIEHLLNAVGKDISIVVQPVTFMKDIKRQLKKLKNYKEYLSPC